MSEKICDCPHDVTGDTFRTILDASFRECIHTARIDYDFDNGTYAVAAGSTGPIHVTFTTREPVELQNDPAADVYMVTIATDTNKDVYFEKDGQVLHAGIGEWRRRFGYDGAVYRRVRIVGGKATVHFKTRTMARRPTIGDVGTLCIVDGCERDIELDSGSTVVSSPGLRLVTPDGADFNRTA